MAERIEVTNGSATYDSVDSPKLGSQVDSDAPAPATSALAMQNAHVESLIQRHLCKVVNDVDTSRGVISNDGDIAIDRFQFDAIETTTDLTNGYERGRNNDTVATSETDDFDAWLAEDYDGYSPAVATYFNF